MKKESDSAQAQPGAAYVNLELFPPVPENARPRRVYFELLGLLDREALKLRGYDPSTLFELPRGTPEREAAYLLARAQAIEEGTVFTTKERNAALEMQMKANGMLTSKGVQLRVALTGEVKSVEGLLRDWGNSRHTLRGNSTVVTAQITSKQLNAGEGKRRRAQQDKGVRKELVKRKQ